MEQVRTAVATVESFSASACTLPARGVPQDRGIYGRFHAVSPKDLGTYIHEFGFRYNTRSDTDAEAGRKGDQASGRPPADVPAACRKVSVFRLSCWKFLA